MRGEGGAWSWAPVVGSSTVPPPVAVDRGENVWSSILACSINNTPHHHQSQSYYSSEPHCCCLDSSMSKASDPILTVILWWINKEPVEIVYFICTSHFKIKAFKKSCLQHKLGRFTAKIFINLMGRMGRILSTCNMEKTWTNVFITTVSMWKLKDFTDLCVRGIKTQAIKHQHHHQQQEYWQTFISNKSASGRITKLWCVTQESKGSFLLFYITSSSSDKWSNEAWLDGWAWCSDPCSAHCVSEPDLKS